MLAIYIKCLAAFQVALDCLMLMFLMMISKYFAALTLDSILQISRRKYGVNAAKYFEIITRNIKQSSAAWNAARRFVDTADSKGLYSTSDVNNNKRIYKLQVTT